MFDICLFFHRNNIKPFRGFPYFIPSTTNEPHQGFMRPDSIKLRCHHHVEEKRISRMLASVRCIKTLSGRFPEGLKCCATN